MPVRCGRRGSHPVGTGWPRGRPLGALVVAAAFAAASCCSAGKVAAAAGPATLHEYRVVEGARVFTDQPYRWASIPAAARWGTGYRTVLEDRGSVTFDALEPGWVIAALWRVDFGLLEQLPEGRRGRLNGWTIVEGDSCSVTGVPAPFRKLQVYRRRITRGPCEVRTDAYVGKWLILGVTRDAAVTGGPAGFLEGPLRITGAPSDHNPCTPGAAVRFEVPWKEGSVIVYRDGREVLRSPSLSFLAPSRAGRYAVVVEGPDDYGVAALTVGFALPAGERWPEGFFPICFFPGWRYRGQFQPAPSRLADLETLSMLDLGANTFYGRPGEDLAHALGARRIVNLRPQTRELVRKVADDEEALRGFRELLDSLSPIPSTTIGFSIEDEPTPALAERLRLFEDAVRGKPGFPHLLYALHGNTALGTWERAGSTVRLARAYPIRKRPAVSIEAQVRRELTAMVELWQRSRGDTPLWMVLQSFGDHGKPDLWDVPTGTQLRLMVSLCLARGTRAITYFCYDSNTAGRELLEGIVSWPFVPENELYGTVKELNRVITAHSGLICSLDWQGPLAEAADPRLDAQILQRNDGMRVAWLTNLSTAERYVGVVRLSKNGPQRTVELAPGGSMVFLADEGTVLLEL